MKITIEGDEDECRAAAMALAMGFQERHCPRVDVASPPTPGEAWYMQYPEGSRAEMSVCYRTTKGDLVRAWTPVTVGKCADGFLYATDDTGQGLGSNDAGSWRSAR